MAASMRMLNLLRRVPLYCAVVNRYADPDATNFLINRGCQRIPNLPLDCYTAMSTGSGPLESSESNSHTPITPFPPSPQTKDKLLYYYVMDISSLLPVLALSPEADHSVLDLCAAPGGKAFALLQFLSLGRVRGGSVALNDSSHGRLKRLKEVVAKCLPKEMRCSVRFTQRRGEEWAKIEQNSYDRVLVDVPCSSDRHNADEWIKKDNIAYPNAKMFSDLQQKLLHAALHAAKLNGLVAYSTCTLSEMENDAVVLNTLTKAREDGIDLKILPSEEVYSPLLANCNWIKTETGTLVVPTDIKNCGPMFTSLIQRC